MYHCPGSLDWRQCIMVKTASMGGSCAMLNYFPGRQLPPPWALWSSGGQLAGNRRFSGTDGYGAHDERNRRGCRSTGGLRGRLPQCQFMTSAVHERGPIAGGATLAAGSGTADGVAYGPRSTEHAWSCQKSTCPSIHGHGSWVAANGGRAAAWAVDEAQALRTAG